MSGGISVVTLGRPFVAKDCIQERISPLATDLAVVLEVALAAHSDLLENTGRGGVLRIASSPDTVKAERLEAEVEDQTSCLRCEALAPSSAGEAIAQPRLFDRRRGVRSRQSDDPSKSASPRARSQCEDRRPHGTGHAPGTRASHPGSWAPTAYNERLRDHCHRSAPYRSRRPETPGGAASHSESCISRTRACSSVVSCSRSAARAVTAGVESDLTWLTGRPLSCPRSYPGPTRARPRRPWSRSPSPDRTVAFRCTRTRTPRRALGTSRARYPHPHDSRRRAC